MEYTTDFFDDVDRSRVQQIRRENRFNFIHHGPSMICFSLGRRDYDFREDFNYEVFYEHLGSAREVYLINSFLEGVPLGKKNLLKRIWEVNRSRKWESPLNSAEKPIIPGVVMGLSFTKTKGVNQDSIIPPKGTKDREKRVAERLAPFLGQQFKDYIRGFHRYSGRDPRQGFHFCTRNHVKLYFSEQMAYVGSANLNAASPGNAEIGAIFQDEAAIRELKACYLALLEDAVSLDGLLSLEDR